MKTTKTTTTKRGNTRQRTAPTEKVAKPTNHKHTTKAATTPEPPTTLQATADTLTPTTPAVEPQPTPATPLVPKTPALEPVAPVKNADARQRDPRLPAPGTVIEKRDRHGNVRCTCTIQDDTILYNGKAYPSISAAALAAAKDLGLQNSTQNGFTFWGLSKPERRADPAARLEHAWQRYHTLTSNAPDAILARHLQQLKERRNTHSE